MSRINELIKEYCPDGVPFKKVKNVYTRVKGTPITAGKMKEIACDDGEIRIFAGGKTIIDAHEKDIPRANITRVPAVLVQSRGVIDVVYYDKPFTFKNEMWAYTSEDIVSVKFLYYVLKNSVQTFRDAASGMGSLPQISLKVTEEFMLPVPPLEVQREIVHILDYFTLLTAELTARKKQYEFYRDNLIKKEQHISEVKKLADVANIYDSLHQTPSYSNSGYSMVRVQDIKGGYVDEDKTLKVDESVWNLFTQKYTPQLNDIVVSRVGSYGNFALIPNDKCCLGQNVALIHPNINPKYLYHVLMSTMTKQWINNNVKGASQKSFSLADIKRVPVPVPKDNIQQRIAEVLDNFESICTNLSIGLPAEIEARQKQYEYYRDKLLSFKELPK